MTYTRVARSCSIVVLFLAGIAFVMSAAFDGSSISLQAASTSRAADVRVQTAPRTHILFRDVKGSYSQHPAVLAELRRYVAIAKAQAVGPVMGIYPMDPDLTPEDELQWQVAVPVAASLQVQRPYAMTVFAPTETVSIDTTVAKLEGDANFLKKWLIDNGFVQTGPTRMLFHDPDNSDPLAVRTTIVYPVKRRARTAAPVRSAR
jgi:hypothetical protein